MILSLPATQTIVQHRPLYPCSRQTDGATAAFAQVKEGLETAKHKEALEVELAEIARAFHGIAYNVYKDSSKDGAGDRATVLGVFIRAHDGLAVSLGAC
jgi:hypothetical protein